MRVTCAVLFILFITACGQTGSRDSRESENPEGHVLLSPDEYEKKMSEEQQFTLLDVRTDMEVEEGRIPGAVQIDWFDENFETRVDKTIDKSNPVFVYCAIGGRSEEACEKLISMGYKSVYNLDGGYKRWTAADKPVSK